MMSKGKIRTYIKDYKFNSLLVKNLVLLLALIIVPLTGMVVLCYYAYSNMQEKEIIVSNEKIAADVCSDLEGIFKEAGTELSYIGFNSNVELYMYETEELRELNYKIQSIQELIKLPILSRDYIDSIFIYSFKSNKVISVNGISNYDQFQDRPCMESYLSQEEAFRTLLVTQSSMRGYMKKQLSVFQDIKYGKSRNGVAVMNLDLDALLEELELPENVTMYLTDGHTVLLSNDREAVGAAVEMIPEYQAIVPEHTVVAEGFSISEMAVQAADLTVITYMGTETYQSQLSTIRSFMLSFLFLMTLVTLALSVLISLRIFRPIGDIVASIQEYKNVLMGEDALFREKDELEYILHSIQMTANVKRDVEEELSERVRLLKKAQAVALQSQINPHFLNNTLDTINWMAVSLLGGRNEISKMTGALSRMLRMTLENTDTIIPVSAEIEHCMNYLMIQEKRYEDKFEVIWQVPAQIYECRTVRVILQPIVENAIYHGIKPLSNKGQIIIGGDIVDGKVFLTVADNGLGMTLQQVEELENNMKSDMIKESRHIGIANVNQRLKLYFGEQYGISVESREAIGTRVTICFPEIASR